MSSGSENIQVESTSTSLVLVHVEKDEGFDSPTFEYCSLLKSTCWEFPLVCSSIRSLPHIESIDETKKANHHWDELLDKFYTPPSQVKMDSNNDVKLSPLKRKRRSKEPTISPSNEESIEFTVELNEEDLFSRRNSKKTKHCPCSMEMMNQQGNPPCDKKQSECNSRIIQEPITINM